MIILLLALNFGIAWFNCWSVGGMWVESKALGGFPRFLAWCGAIQSVVGFSCVFVYALAFGFHSFHRLSDHAYAATLSLWYLLVIIPAIGSGLIITIQSWIVAFRERSIANMGTAAYNTFAQAYNMYEAIDGIGDALGVFGSLFNSSSSSDDDDDDGGGVVLLVIALVAFALLGGVLLTWALIRMYSGRLPKPVNKWSKLRA